MSRKNLGSTIVSLGWLLASFIGAAMGATMALSGSMFDVVDILTASGDFSPRPSDRLASALLVFSCAGAPGGILGLAMSLLIADRHRSLEASSRTALLIAGMAVLTGVLMGFLWATAARAAVEAFGGFVTS